MKMLGAMPTVLCHATYAFALNCDTGFCAVSCTGYHRSMGLLLTIFMEDDLCRLLFQCLFGKSFSSVGVRVSPWLFLRKN
jgi:hypothetical protein